MTNQRFFFSFYLTLQLVLGGAHGFVTPIPRQMSPSAASVSAKSATRLQAISPIATGVAILRGGAKAAALDLGQEVLKIQSMATYSTITALIMNASLRLYTSQKFEIKVGPDGKRPRQVQWLESIFTASSILCIVCGVFTAVLFNVLGIYSKEALGMGNESGYLAFRNATAIFRKYGFRTFLITSISFVTSFLASVVEKTSDEDRRGQIILVASIVLAVVCSLNIHTVLSLATKHIYTAEFRAKNHIA